MEQGKPFTEKRAASPYFPPNFPLPRTTAQGRLARILDVSPFSTLSNISETDAAVVACAVEKKITLVLADDSGVRDLAEREGLSIMGSVGILTQGRLEGAVHELKPLLDKLVVAGFLLTGAFSQWVTPMD
ncbi:MAG: DUF3368 domain-containing protein [Candidatus Binatia bacterium]